MTLKHDLQSHFEGKDPLVKQMFDKLLKGAQKFGPVKVEPKQTSIHLANRFGFAGVYTRKNYINLEIHLAYPLKSTRVTKLDQASANRYHHTIVLRSLDEIDAELFRWLKEAYLLKS